jgi:hypothetical protein
VLLVDDILDTRRTLSAVRDTLVARGASEVATCCFLDKPARREGRALARFRVLRGRGPVRRRLRARFRRPLSQLPYVAR